jgi:periplasmic divalent cation tolerance protein
MTDFSIAEQSLDVVILMTTVPAGERSEALVRSLVTEGLAACVHALPTGTSTYRWEGKVETASEATLLIKTVREHADAVARRVHDERPYELPELLAVPVTGGSIQYLDWIKSQLGSET